MAISQEYVAELSRRTDIAELVGTYVELKRSGRMEKGLCPFHNEKTPSFYVYPETNSYYCFGCGSGGDAITFIRQLQNLDYVEAVKFLASRVGMPMPDEDDSATKLRGRMLSINRETAHFYVERLNGEGGRAARAYLRGRGLTDKTIRRFGIGYAPDDFGALRDHMKGKGFSEDELILANVCKRSNKGGMYDAFRDRVMFPIIDLRGNVIAFGGRRLGENGPKYLNSSDTPVFKKSRNLFALNVAKKSASKRFLLAEGYMDVISLHQAGFDTAVATLGTALTAEQAKLISDYATDAVICYDSDEAGQKATARAIEIFKNTPVKVTVLSMEGAKDPDEFIGKFGADRFEQLLDGSNNTIEYALNKAKRGYDLATPDGRAAYLKEALEILAAQASPTEGDIYAGRLSEETDVTKTAILQQLETVQNKVRRQRRREWERRVKEETLAAGVDIPFGAGGEEALGVAFAEQQLVAAMVKNPADYVPLVSAQLTVESFINTQMGEVFKVLCDMHAAGEYIDMTTLAVRMQDSAAPALISRVLANNYDIGFSKQDVELFIGRIRQGANAPQQAAGMSAEDLNSYIQNLREQKQ